MIDALMAWRATGAVESIVVLFAPAMLLLGIGTRRWPRLDAMVAWVAAAAVAGLGAFASHQRLLALPWQLSELPERQLVGRIAQTEAQAFGVLGGALLLASVLTGAWAWRHSRPQDGPVAVAPTATAALAVPAGLAAARLDGPLPSPGDGFGLWALGSLMLVIASVLRPSARWQGPALAWLLGTSLLAHGALARALVLDPDVGAALPGLLSARDIAATLAVVGCAVALFSWRHRAAWPAMGFVLALGPLAAHLPAQWSRHPVASPWPTDLAHPAVEPTRLAGGCLVGPEGTERPHGLHSEAHALAGCAPGSLRTVAVRTDTPLSQIVAHAGDDIGLLSRVRTGPERLTPWLTARWALPVWRMRGGEPSPRPVRGSLVVTQLEPLEMIGPNGPTDLATALSATGRIEVLVVPGAGTVGAMAELCARAVAVRPQGTRCGLALGSPTAWSRWATRPAPSNEGW